MNSWATALFGSTVAFISLAILATAGRFYARRLSKTGYGLDDWIILVDTVLAAGLAAMMIWACFDAGVGLKIDEMTPEIAVRYLKQTWANELIVTPIIGTVKIAVLIFYKSVFITPRFKMIANIFIVLCLCWTIAFTCTLAFNLIPFNLEWNLQPDRPHNLNFGAMLTSMGVFDLILDVCILSLPVFVIKQLNLSNKRKMVVTALFWTGAFCIVASAVRLAYITKFLTIEGTDDAFSGVTAEISLWSTIELCASIMAASLPTLGPLFKSGQGIHSLVSRTRAMFASFASKTRLLSAKKEARHSSLDSEDRRAVSMWQKPSVGGNTTTVEIGTVVMPKNLGSGIRVDKTFRSEVV